MQDQFKRVHSDQDYQNKILVVTGSDASGSAYNPLWGDAIYNELKDEPIINNISWLGVADVSSVPFFLKKMVKNKFPKERENWALLDWKGQFDKAYGFKPGLANILVFNTKRQLVYQTTGKEVNADILADIVSTIRRSGQ